jgi:hypothetical protein
MGRYFWGMHKYKSPLLRKHEINPEFQFICKADRVGFPKPILRRNKSSINRRLLQYEFGTFLAIHLSGEAMGTNTEKSRVGFYYFPDTTHYRKNDLYIWLPRLEHLGAGWLTLATHPQRAIPEFFLRELIDHQITPILHLHQNLAQPPDYHSQQVLFNAYAQWGIRYITLYDRPNRRLAWEPALWSQSNLVERFIDHFLPLAEAAWQAGLTPIFPPLEPGGDYWDTMFLQTSLQALIRRKKEQVIRKLALSAYAWTHNRPLHWGAGGPAQWPNSRPYFTSDASQDQIGFHIYDWYLSIAKKVMGFSPSIFLLGAGCRVEDCALAGHPLDEHKRCNLELLNSIEADPVSNPSNQIEQLPQEVKAVNFWLLAAEPNHPETKNAWFPANLRPLPVAEAFMRQVTTTNKGRDQSTPEKSNKLGHYFLIPEQSWQKKDPIYQAIPNLSQNPYLSIGHLVNEAEKAQRVTIMGIERWLDESCFTRLTEAGCLVEEIYGDGTHLASKLMNLTI